MKDNIFFRCELVFENCFVPNENVLGQEGKGKSIVNFFYSFGVVVLFFLYVVSLYSCLCVILVDVNVSICTFSKVFNMPSVLLQGFMS